MGVLAHDSGTWRGVQVGDQRREVVVAAAANDAPLPGDGVVEDRVAHGAFLVLARCGGWQPLAGNRTTPRPRGAPMSSAAPAADLGHTEPLPLAPPQWMARLMMARLMMFDPKRVVFAHDAAVWEPA
jgi:hypothetical protein